MGLLNTTITSKIYVLKYTECHPPATSIPFTIRRRSDYIIGFITPAIGPNKFKKLTRPIVPTHNLRGKVWMEDSTHGSTDN